MLDSNSESNYSDIDYMSLMAKNAIQQPHYNEKNDLKTQGNGRISPLNNLIINKNKYNPLNNSEFTSLGSADYSSLSNGAYNSLGNAEYTSLNTGEYNSLGSGTYNSLTHSEYNSVNHSYNQLHNAQHPHNKPHSSASVPLVASHHQSLQNNSTHNNSGFFNASALNDGVFLQRSSSATQMRPNFNTISPSLHNNHYENTDSYAAFQDGSCYSAMDNSGSSSSFAHNINQPYQIYHHQELYFQQQNLSSKPSNNLQDPNIIYRYEMNPAEYASDNNQNNPMNSFYSANSETNYGSCNNFSRPSTPTESIISQAAATKIVRNVSNDFGNCLNKEPEATRTLLLTNISPTTTSKTILNHVKLGIVQQLLILPDPKNMHTPETHSAKLTFLNLKHAIEFYYDAMLKKLTIDNNQIQVSYTQEQQIGPLTLKLMNMSEYNP